MAAVLGELPADDDRWYFEPKWDGVRAVVAVDGDTVRARTRNDNDLMASFPELDGLRRLAVPMVLDGELVALDDAGRPSFQRIQQRLGVTDPRSAAARAAEVPVVYVVFDLLRLGDVDVTPLAFTQRRELLEQVVEAGPTWRLSPSHRGDGEDWLQSARDHALEGVMAKRADSVYRPGRRSPDWRKIKIRHEQEFVVCGWTPGTGQRAELLGALVLGCHHDGALRWAGNVGTGFTDADLRWWRAELDATRSGVSPFDDPPGHPALAGAGWVTPREVVQVTYAEWTGDRRLRAPVLLGRRLDVDVDQVRCEG